MRVRMNRLYNPDNNGGGGGSTPPSNNNSELVAQLRRELADTKKEVSDLTKANVKLQADHERLQSEHGTVTKRLGGYEAAEARKTALREALESKDYKGKITVDEEKVMKYLSRGDYDPAKVGDEVKEAIEMLGAEVPPTGSSMNDRGAGDAPQKLADRANDDPVGALILG